jgi:hypothetical protein
MLTCRGEAAEPRISIRCDLIDKLLTATALPALIIVVVPSDINEPELLIDIFLDSDDGLVAP